MNLKNKKSLTNYKYEHSYNKRAIISVPTRKVIRYKSKSNENTFDFSDFSFFKYKTVEIINTSYIGFKRDCTKRVSNIQARQHQAIPSLAYLPVPKKNKFKIFNKRNNTSFINQ